MSDTATLERLQVLHDIQTRHAAQARRNQTRYLDNPAGWATDCVNWPADGRLFDYQADILRTLGEHHRIAVVSPHGVGKSTTNALAILWFAVTADAAETDWKILTTAGVSSQLEEFLWPEIRRWAKRLNWERVGRPPFTRDELLKEHLNLEHGQAFARTTNDPAFIEGAHADRILVVADEAKAIPAEVFDAIEGALAGTGQAYALVTSTPDAPAGRFYDIHARKLGYEDWKTRHVTLDEAIAAGQLSAHDAEQRARQWGATSSVYRRRILGEFASDDEDAIIPLAWIEQAIERHHQWEREGRPEPAGRRVIGVDVARSGQDKTVYATRQGDVIYGLEKHSGQDTMVTAGQVGVILDRHPTDQAVVDVDGLGSGVFDRLREQRRHVTAFSASHRATRKDHTGEFGFINQRAQQWWGLRERLDPARHPTVCLPDDDELIGELTSTKWRITSAGRIQVELKEDIKKRLGRSTDSADAVVMSFATSGSVNAGGAIPYTDREVPGGAVRYT